MIFLLVIVLLVLVLGGARTGTNELLYLAAVIFIGYILFSILSNGSIR